MFPHSTSVLVLPSQAFHSMAFTTKVVVVSSESTVVSLDDDELPQAVTARASVAARARGRNII
jgi:hypothetical protein